MDDKKEDKLTTQSLDPVVAATIISISWFAIKAIAQTIIGWLGLKWFQKIVAWWKGRHAKYNPTVSGEESQPKA